MTTPQNTAEFDPLADNYEKTPALSFDPNKPHGIPEGKWTTVTVRGKSKLIPSRDDNGKPEFYEDSGKPVQKVVLPVTYQGEDYTLFAKFNNVAGGLCRALKDAQRDLGQQLDEGSQLALRWEWDTSRPKVKGNHPKKYEARASAADPLAEQPAPAKGGGLDFAKIARVGADDEPPF
jgi:hypothetical protein